MQYSTAPQPDPTALLCTVQPHASGGFTPIVHHPGTPAPNPSPWALTFPTAPDAVRWAQNHYGVVQVTVITLADPAA
jgi:hypothetical protein